MHLHISEKCQSNTPKLHFMNSKILITILLVAILGSAYNCKKNDNEEPLPPYTEIGANTFSFRVQGKEYDTKVDYLPAFPRISVVYNYVDTFLHKDYLFEIEGNRVFSGDNKHIIINVQSMTHVGDYKLSIYNGGGYGNFAIYEDDGPAQSLFGTDTIHTGDLTITKLDTINHIIAGKFAFKAIQSCVNRICNSVITVDGQFDIKYTPNIDLRYY